jgi:hypothetical protein
MFDVATVETLDKAASSSMDGAMKSRMFEKTSMLTVSGRCIDFLDIDPALIDIEDAYLGIIRQARFNGQTKSDVAWTLDGHLDLGVRIIRARADRGLLATKDSDFLQKLFALHDFWEYAFGDIIKPFKNALAALGAGDALKALERAGDIAVWRGFGIDPAQADAFHAHVKKIDHDAYVIERTMFYEIYRKPEDQDHQCCAMAHSLIDDLDLPPPIPLDEPGRMIRISRLFSSIFDLTILTTPPKELSSVRAIDIMAEIINEAGSTPGISSNVATRRRSRVSV